MIFLERSKQAIPVGRGESVSTSDVARILLESAKDDRLDFRLEAAELQRSPGESFWSIRRKWEQRLALTRAEWIVSFLQACVTRFEEVCYRLAVGAKSAKRTADGIKEINSACCSFKAYGYLKHSDPLPSCHICLRFILARSSTAALSEAITRIIGRLPGPVQVAAGFFSSRNPKTDTSGILSRIATVIKRSGRLVYR